LLRTPRDLDKAAPGTINSDAHALGLAVARPTSMNLLYVDGKTGLTPAASLARCR